MKKLNEIMQELGFDKEGNQEVQKAFIKNLIKQSEFADKVKAIHPNQGINKIDSKNTNNEVKKATYMSQYRKKQPEQLSFDLQNCGSIKTSKKPKSQVG